MPTNIIKAIKGKNLLFRVAILCLATYISAIVFNLFFVPTNMTAGGSSGLSIVIHEITGIEQGNLVTIIYIITLVLSFIFLDLEKSFSIVLSTIIYPIFVKMTGNITNFIQLDYSDMTTICIISGILNGVTSGLIYRIGFNPGGLSVIAQIIYKYFKISISKVNLFMSFVIVLMGGYYFGINHILYAIIVMYITAFMTDKVLLGISKNKYVYIVTSEEDKVHEFITEHLKHGVTKLACETGFMERKKFVLMTSIPTRDYTILKEGIHLIDKKAFLVATDAYQSYGGM